MSGTRRKAGPLGPEVEGYRAWLVAARLHPETIRNMLADLGQVGRWLASEGLDRSGPRRGADGGVPGRPARGWPAQIPGTRAMAPLLGYLREIGSPLRAAVGDTAGRSCLGQYRSWLVAERGLAATTVRRYENTARRFLQEQACQRWRLRPRRR